MTEPTTTEKSPARGIHITERAAREVQRVITDNKLSTDTWLRVGALGGGCSGFSYQFDFDEAGPTDADLSFEEHGVKIVIDKKSEFFMGGTTVDFNDGLLNRGFVFNNPSAASTCGCGTSFSVTPPGN